jgi:hypothetical protein
LHSGFENSTPPETEHGTKKWRLYPIFMANWRMVHGHGVGITSSLLSTPRERELITGVFCLFQLELELRL